MTKKVGYRRILILASIGVLPLIKISPVNPHMHRLLLGGGGVFFGVRFFWVRYYGSGPTKGWCVARQWPVSNNREVFSLGYVPRTRYHGKFVLLVRPELQEGEVGRSRHA
jgi:hypothetical protein